MMKLTLILIFVLINISSAISGDLPWKLVETKSNFKKCIEKEFRDKCIDFEEYSDGVRYYGEYTSNKRHGFGIAIFNDQSRYEGFFENGWRTFGTQLFLNGDIYEGSFKDGQFNGDGKYSFKEGSSYIGQFKNGKYHGIGIFKYTSGGIYEGSFHEGLSHGYGVAKFPDGGTYSGNYEFGQFNGKGLSNYSNGDMYFGSFKNNYFDGEGDYLFKNGELYSGEFKNGKRHGIGTLQYPNGDSYEGSFENGTFSKNGIYTYKNGDKYIGNFEHGAATGFGEFHFLDGRKYIGHYSKGRFSGTGVELLGEHIISRQGFWDDGELIKAELLDLQKFPNSLGIKSKKEIESINLNVLDSLKLLKLNNEFNLAVSYIASKYSSLNNLENKKNTGNDIIKKLISLKNSLPPDDHLFEIKKIIIDDKINDINTIPIEELNTKSLYLTEKYPVGHYFRAIADYYRFLYASWTEPATITKYARNFLNENNIRAVEFIEYNNSPDAECKNRSRAFTAYFTMNGLEKDINNLKKIGHQAIYALDLLTNCYGHNKENLKGFLISTERYLRYVGNPDKQLEVTALLSSIGTPTAVETVSNMQRKGHILRSAGKFEEAEVEFTESIKFAQENNLSDWKSDLLIDLSILFIDIKNFEKAEDILIKVLALSNINDNSNWYKCHILSFLARSQEQQSNYNNAITLLKTCVNMVETERKQMIARAKFREKSFYANSTFGRFYESLAELLINTGRLSEGQQVLDMLKEEEQIEFVQRSRSVDSMRLRIEETPKEQIWTVRYKKISERLGALGLELQNLEKIPKNNLSESQKIRYKILKEDISVAELAFSGFLQEMRKDFANKGSAREIETTETSQTSVKEMQSLIRSLGDGVALLQYYITDEKIGILLTTPGVQIARSFKINRNILNIQISQLRRALRDSKSDPLSASKALYKILLEPVENDLNQANVKTIMLSLDGALRYIPFGALNDGKKFAIERWNMPLFTSVVREKLRNPAYQNWRAAGFGVTRSHGEFPALPAVKREIDSVVKTFENSGVIPGVIFLDDAFSSKQFKDIGHQKVELLHIASHFKFSPGTEENSFLLLGNGQQLTLAEIRKKNYRFDNVDLLTLSACETGLGGGRDEMGKEIEGFGVIAQQQGANAVLATLWSVEDQSTATLMADMYRRRQVQGQNKIEALRQAQVELMKQPKYVHPFYWAPFVLMGNWK
jgi:CHAT domain-containing protein